MLRAENCVTNGLPAGFSTTPVQIGEYRAGSDALADAAIAARGDLREFACQSPSMLEPYGDTMARLAALEGEYGQNHREALART